MNRINNRKTGLIAGVILLLGFVLFTFLVIYFDVQPVGQKGTNIGFSTVNTRFHQLTGSNMTLYTITDWLGIVPILICMCFGVLGLVQLIKRRSLLKVDIDIILLGIYYIIVILGYLIFEMIPINYRPIPIDGYMEASYPSSTTLLVLSVMPTLKFQIDRRAKNKTVKGITTAFVVLFSAFMVIGRLISGVHWLTDIIGSVILSAGVYLLYQSSVLLIEFKKEKRNENTRIERKS